MADNTAMEVEEKKEVAKPAVDSNSLKDGNVVAKYKDASLIVNTVLLQLLHEIQPGKTVYELCVRGDTLLHEAMGKAFKSPKIQKGAMPTTINVNNFCENFSPAQDDKTELRWDDVVKVELAVHIDGYVASAGHTVILHEKESEPITGDVANAVCAAYFASELVVRKMKAGITSNDLSSVITQVASTFHSTPVEGTVSAAHKKFVLAATPESMTLVPSSHTPVTLEANNVYSINILFSTDAKANALKSHPSLNAQLFARDPSSKYNAKLKSAKECVKWIEENASSVFPFSLRSLADLPRTRAGLPELAKNGLVNPIPVKIVQSSERNRKEVPRVVGFRTMVLLTESGVERVTGTDFGLPFVKCEHELQGELKKEMEKSVKGKIKVSPEVAKELGARKDVEMK